MKILIVSVAFAAVSAIPSVGQVAAPDSSLTAGVISGTVRGADGTTVTQGVVSTYRAFDGSHLGAARISASAAIAADGSFKLPPLVNGGYQICVQAPGSVWLNSCEWLPNDSPTVVLSSQQASASVNIVLKRGALVSVQLNDPGHLLQPGLVAGAHFVLGVGTDSHYFRTAQVVAESASARTYQLLIPFDRSINIAVARSLLQLQAASGAILSNAGSSIPVLVPSGQQPPTLVLTVAGISAP